ncbi:GTPase ObgE [Anaerosphaera multitolerans]|uniref:GTPase Obg n=1 Tax=Anaerosphaera multitolerans TaxID=2487351 RepID=A0A437S7L1_9FIRM|nr:GTPase ObgE [Anaerosphaera multitolerans]RVU54918.1 GTPase ObgE [Anaerosphaera multitolerans]
MFIDVATIKLKAGKGGDGAVAWRREKYEPAGGPAGGDGGDGGNVIFKTDEGIHTLMDFRYKREYKAQNGENGRSKKQFGKDGEDIILKVPVGTLVKDKKTGGVIVDLKEKNQEFIIAKGGRGGKGNARFTTSTRQAPSFAQAGSKGVEREVILELKLLADVGLIGFPNVGKSTLLSVVSAAKPKVANYHFTTLKPNLGVVNLGPEMSFVIADIPGLIEGASEGLGLGDEFLKHVERTKLLIHVLDISGSEGRNPIEDFYKINAELKNYNEKLSEKPQIIFANKMDIPGAEENLELFKNELGENYKIFSGSAATTENLQDLMKYVFNELQNYDFEYETYDEEYIETYEREEGIQVYMEDGKFKVDGPYIEKLMHSTNFEDIDSLRYFQENLRKNNVIDKLKELGIDEGDSVFILEYEFEFFE